MRRPVHPNQLQEGDTVRDFRIVRRLGVGGFSFVFLVEREGRLFSMKVAARPASPADEDRVDAWMRREVATLEHSEHPHLLPVLEWGRWPDPETGYGYFVTPYIPGSTFHTWRLRGVPLDRVVFVLCLVLDVLATLHERGICHRDLKADNILVREGDDSPFLIDFGTVHLPWARTLTEGLAPGTLYCQPPEAVTFLLSKEATRPGSRLEALPSADLYAFGVLLYETLTGCRPFSTRLSLEQLLVAIASTPAVDASLLAPEAPRSLCLVAQMLMQKEPGKRPVSAREVGRELRRLLEEEAPHLDSWRAPAKPLSEVARLRESFPELDVLEEPRKESAGPTPLPPPPKAPPRERARWAPGRTGYLVALVLGVGLLLGLGLLLAPAFPVPSEKGTQPVPSAPHGEAPAMSSSPTPAPSRVCALLTSLLGLAASQLPGCATTSVRPDPIGYLARCSPEARATPVELGLAPEENASFLEAGTPVSEESIEDGGALNLKPGPVTATMYAHVKEKEVELKISGEAVTTPHRVYIQFDRLHLPDGSSRPICGVAVDGLHQYGIPTYAKLPMRGAKVDPARVDPSPGSVVLNDPRFETVLKGPEDYPVPRIELAPPDWR